MNGTVSRVSVVCVLMLAGFWAAASEGRAQSRGKIIEVPQPKSRTIAFPSRFEGDFTQIDQLDVKTPSGPVSMTITIHARLAWVPPEKRATAPAGTAARPDPDDDLLTPLPKGPVSSRLYVLDDAVFSVERRYHSGAQFDSSPNHVRAAALTHCDADDKQTYTMKQLPPAAFRDFSLELHTNGEYLLTLAMRDGFLNITERAACTLCCPRGKVEHLPVQAFIHNEIRVSIGPQRGQAATVNTDDPAALLITGTSRPQTAESGFGPMAVNGEWTFAGR